LNLLVDIGNTLQKIAVYDNDECLAVQSFFTITKDIITSFCDPFSIHNSIISSVADIDKQVYEYLKTNSKLIPFTSQTQLPIIILYQGVETLGLDRIANAVGVATLFPNRNVLSIQAGTCLVFDFVNDKNEYLGGSISPGLKMRMEALHKKTKNLPLLSEPFETSRLIGRDTFESIRCGVLKGMGYEIDGFINDYQTYYNELVVLFTGGDALYLQQFIKNTIFATSNLVLKGLNEIIKYNV
jgi:type III pantothenate kinase